MQKNTFESWLNEVEYLFLENGKAFPDWLSDDDIYEAHCDGLTPVQFYDNMVQGYFL